MSQVRILIVERERDSAAQVEQDLRAAGFTEVERCLPAAAVERTSQCHPGLVLMEFSQDDLGGAERCRAVKQACEPAFVPVLLLTGEDPASVVTGFDAGADDCIHWPYDVAEMVARVESMLRHKSLHDELRRVNAKLTELSTRDELTGLYNRRYLFERLASEVERAVRYQQPLSVLMLDMDDFKPINDRYGHLVGDELFRRAAEVFRSVPRRVDVVARYGGDEVAMLLPASGVEAAVQLGNRVCDTMASRVFAVADLKITITVSLGVACLDPRNPITSDELVQRADVALYRSKNAGGNLVTVWQPGMKGETAD